MPFAFLFLLVPLAIASTETPTVEVRASAETVSVSTTALRGVHLTGWGAGSPKIRRLLIADIRAAGLNAAAIALKETDGFMFVKGVPLAREIGAYINAIPDLPAVVREFKEAGIYTIARIVLFKDDRLARRRPDLAVRRPDGGVWTNAKGVAWVDPYRKEVWEYNLAIASRAAAAGFDEIQFDYIRFPSDGDTRLCRYSRADHTARTAARNLAEFLEYARARLKPLGVKLSLCVFGATTTDDSGLGIGQHLQGLARQADYIAPMMYPSHYNRGDYNIRSPNREPYKTIRLGVRDALGRLGAEGWRLRPYLQDFSLGVRYDADKVRAQILAAQRYGVTSWMLWNPHNRYTWSATRLNNRFLWEDPR